MSHMAWEAYNKPAMNTLILIDQDNKVVDTKTFWHSKDLEDRATAMASRIYYDRFDFND